MSDTDRAMIMTTELDTRILIHLVASLIVKPRGKPRRLSVAQVKRVRADKRRLTDEKKALYAQEFGCCTVTIQQARYGRGCYNSPETYGPAVTPLRGRPPPRNVTVKRSKKAEFARYFSKHNTTEKAVIIFWELINDPERSNIKIGKKIGSNHATICQHRHAMEELGMIEVYRATRGPSHAGLKSGISVEDMRQMRRDGMGLREIAKEAGMTYQAVALHVSDVEMERQCVICGEKFITARTNTVCCSKACQLEHARVLRRLNDYGHKKKVGRVCTHCGGRFRGYAHSKFCGPRCSGLSHRTAEQIQRDIDILDRYRPGNGPALAKEYGISKGLVYKILRGSRA